MTELTLGGAQALPSNGGTEVYAIADEEGKVIDRPLTRLNPIDASNARSYANSKAYEQCPALVERFVTYTGTKVDQQGNEVMNTFFRLGLLERMKGAVPTPATSAFIYPKDEDGNVASNAVPIATRLWTVIPEVDLSTDEGLQSYLQTGRFPFRIVPAGEVAPEYPRTPTGKLKAKTKVPASLVLNIPRTAYKNVVIVDSTQEADGSVIPTRVRMAFYLRAKFVDRANGRVTVPNVDKPVFPSLFVSIWERQAVDVTDDILALYTEKSDEFEGDMDATMHACLSTLFADPDYANTAGHRVLELIARMTTASMVEELPREVRRAHSLDDRMRLYAIELYDCYFGVERPADEGKNEFVDFHGRLASLNDPMRLHARNLQGKTRLNNGANVVLFQ